ncbi:MAG: L,D-transpeptidase family protein [Planctomycetota bacterium]|jgi:LysM repeat protein
MPAYTPAGAPKKSGVQTVVVVVVLLAVAVGGYFIFRNRGGGNGTNATQQPTPSGDSTAKPPDGNDKPKEDPPPPPPTPPGEIDGREEFRNGDYASAAKKLAAYVKKNPKSAAAFYMLGRSYMELGKAADAEAALGKAVELEPRGANGSVAAQCLGDLLWKRCYEKVEEQDRTKWERIREVYSIALRTAPFGPDRTVLVERLTKLNGALLWSGMLTKDAVQHTVMPGDNVEKIGVQHGLPRDCTLSISRINNLKSNRIAGGQKLKVIKPLSMEVYVSKSKFTLTAFLNGYFFSEFKIGIGKGGATPTGEFVVATKDKNPNWTKTLPDGSKKVFPFGHEENILGSRWLGFKDRPEIGALGLGIHGTGEPESIGTKSSAGCIRMHNKDVDLLFDFTPIKTKVVIVN